MSRIFNAESSIMDIHSYEFLPLCHLHVACNWHTGTLFQNHTSSYLWHIHCCRLDRFEMFKCKLSIMNKPYCSSVHRTWCVNTPTHIPTESQEYYKRFYHTVSAHIPLATTIRGFARDFKHKPRFNILCLPQFCLTKPQTQIPVLKT